MGFDMAAPIYSQIEADRLIGMQKEVEYEALENAQPGRPTNFEETKRFTVLPSNGDENVRFAVQITHNYQNETFSLSLFGTMIGRPKVMLARYEVQDLEHENPEGRMPVVIEPGEFHRHLYSEEYMRAGRPDWYAEPLAGLSSDGLSPKQQFDRLRYRFLEDMRIEFVNKRDHQMFLGFGART